MRWLEVRRHSVTKRSRGPGSHLSQEGVALARLVGSTLEPFASVVTSAAPRAIETALAMGYGVDETVDLPSGYLPGQLAHHDQWHWPQPYRRYAELLAHLPELAAVAKAHRALWARLTAVVPDGAAVTVRSSEQHGSVSVAPGLCKQGVTGSSPVGSSCEASRAPSRFFLSQEGWRHPVSVLVSVVLVCPRPGAFIASLRERTRSPADSSEPRFADLESGLGSRPRGFESRILRGCDKGNTPPR
jgi:phosphohistidine phosphatase SixA